METKNRVRHEIMASFFTLALLASLVAPIALTPASAEGVVNGNENSEVLHLHSADSIDPLMPPPEWECTMWHELYPEFCNEYHLEEHEDTNGDGDLSPCDRIKLNNAWYHVDEVTVTMLVVPEIVVTKVAEELMYLEFEGGYELIEAVMLAPMDSIWCVIGPLPYPPVPVMDSGNFIEPLLYCLRMAGWEDNGDEVLSECDQIALSIGPVDTMDTEIVEKQWYHVEEVTVDIIVSPIDKTPPKTTKEYGEPYYTDGVGEWITADTPIYLDATDEDSGVDYTNYRVWYDGDKTDWLTYAEPFTMNDIGMGMDGVYAIEWYSVDNAGNEESWEELAVETDAGEYEAYSAIETDTLGTIHMVYTEEGSQSLVYEMSPDFGETWTGRTVLVSGLAEASHPDIKIAPNGDIHIVFTGYLPRQEQRISHIWYNFVANNYSYESAADPANWEPRVLVDDTGRDNVYPQIAIDFMGIVHCVWIGDSDGIATGGLQDIFYSKFDGSSWSPLLNLYASTTSEPGQPGPQIIADPYDHLHIVFLDSNQHKMKYLTYNAFLGEWGSYYGGSWNTGVADDIGNSSASYGTIAGMAIEGAVLHIAWQDVRNGDGEVYENIRDLTMTEGFGSEWQITFDLYIDDDGTSVGKALMESGQFDNLHLFYRDSMSYDIWYMEYSSSWSEPVKAADSGHDNMHLWPQMAVDNLDIPLLTYTKANIDSSEYDIYFRKPYHIQTPSVDKTPPITTKEVGEPKYGPNDEWVTPDTMFTLYAADYCGCKKYALLVAGSDPSKPALEQVFEKNVAATRDMLITIGWHRDNIKVMTDVNAGDVEAALKDYADPKKYPNCCIFLFKYEGHGSGYTNNPDHGEHAGGTVSTAPEGDEATDDISKQGGNKIDEALDVSGTGTTTDDLYDDQLAELLAAICHCKNIVIELDTCHAGGFKEDIDREMAKEGKLYEFMGAVHQLYKAFGLVGGNLTHTFEEYLNQELMAPKFSVQTAYNQARRKYIDYWEKYGKDTCFASKHIRDYGPEFLSSAKESKYLKCPGTGSSRIRTGWYHPRDPMPIWEGELNETVSFYLTEHGEYTLEYWAVDDIGNEEVHHIQTHFVDSMPPENAEGYPSYEVGGQNPDGTYQITINDILCDTDSGVKKVVAKVENTVSFEADDINLPEYEFCFVANLDPGDHTLTIEAWDMVGNYLQKVVNIIILVPATIDIEPDTLNLRSRGKWITACIELPWGYDVNDIDVATVFLNNVIPAEPKPVEIGDCNSNGISDLMVKFDRAAVQFILTQGDQVELTIRGEVAGILFQGSDSIRVINK